MEKDNIEKAKELGVNIGENCRVCANVHYGSEPFLITIGNHVTISYLVDFITHDGGTWVFREKPGYKGIMKVGKIHIKDNCFIGAGSTILPDVTIGPNTVIGARSVVTKTIPPNCVAAGNPARVICSLDEYIKKCVENNKTYNKNYKKNGSRKERILSLMEGREEK